MIELASTPIATEAATNIMVNDAAALLGKDIHCPLARKIINALALLDIAITAHSSPTG